MNRELLTEILKQDYEILEAENGEAALKMLEQYGTGIALVMPKMDGFQVLTVMNERRLLEDIPVIMISSEDSGKYISEAYGFGVSDYIRRPFDARVVYQSVLNTTSCTQTALPAPPCNIPDPGKEQQTVL